MNIQKTITLMFVLMSTAGWASDKQFQQETDEKILRAEQQCNEIQTLIDAANPITRSIVQDGQKLKILSQILASTEQAVRFNPTTAFTSYYNTAKKLPYSFTSYKFKIPSGIKAFGKNVIGVTILIGFTDEKRARYALWDTLEERNKKRTERKALGLPNLGRLDEDLKYDIDTYYGVMWWYIKPTNFLKTFNPEKNKNILLQLTFENTKKLVVPLQTTKDKNDLHDLINDLPFFEEGYLTLGQPSPPDTWDPKNWKKRNGNFEWIDTYPHSVYTEIHEAMTTDVRKALAGYAAGCILEVGARDGKLSQRIFKELAAKDTEFHVYTTEYSDVVMKLAKDACKDLSFGKNTIEVSHADVVHLLHDLADPEYGAPLAHIEALKARKMPLIILASGVLTSYVLNDAFASVRALQNMYRLQPDLLLASGCREVLANQHIWKNLGFETLDRYQGPWETNYFNVRPKKVDDVASYFEKKLHKNPTRLDLSLNPDPLATLKKIDIKLLKQVKVADISHAFFRHDELKDFLILLQASCPKLETIIYDCHFDDDRKHFHAVVDALKNHTYAIAVRQTDNPRDIAYSRNFFNRITSTDTPEVLKEWATQDPEEIIFHDEENEC